MREYKFRGKARGEWVHGSLIVCEDGHCVINWVDGLRHVSTDIEVVPETVGQFTGLKDSTGKEIYEGDIIASDYADYRALVAFRAGMFVATWGPNTAYQALYGVLRLKGLRVIGNVHDNPELLRLCNA